MEPTEITNLAQDYMKVWSANNDHYLDKLADPAIEVDYSHFEKACNGIESFRELLKMTYSYFPDLTIQIQEIIPVNTQVTVLWQYSGTHTSGSLFGVQASGKYVTVCGISVLEIENNKVIREYGVVDNLSLLTDLGILKS